MMLYLLVKEHNLTGLKYLCKKSARSFDECKKYKGSGTYWKKHIAKSIITPFGIFGSISEASKQIEGYTYKMIWDRIQNDTQWRYLKLL